MKLLIDRPKPDVVVTVSEFSPRGSEEKSQKKKIRLFETNYDEVLKAVEKTITDMAEKDKKASEKNDETDTPTPGNIGTHKPK